MADVELLQAKIEALRADVAAVKESLTTELRLVRGERDRAMQACETIAGHLAKAEARADKLAEALREAYRQVRELCDCYGHVYPEASFVRYEALLREQEEGE